MPSRGRCSRYRHRSSSISTYHPQSKGSGVKPSPVSASVPCIPSNRTLEGEKGKNSATYRRPPRLGNEHLRLVRQPRGKLDVVVLEELPRPPRRLVDRHVREPRVHIRHAVVHVLQNRRAEVAAGVGVAHGDVVAELLEPRPGIGDVGQQQLRALLANRAVGLVAAAVGIEPAINRMGNGLGASIYIQPASHTASGGQTDGRRENENEEAART